MLVSEYTAVAAPNNDGQSKWQHTRTIPFVWLNLSTGSQSSNWMQQQCYKKKFTCVKRTNGRDLTQFYDKSPYTHRKIQKASWQHTKTPPKQSSVWRQRTNIQRKWRGYTIITQTSKVMKTVCQKYIKTSAMVSYTPSVLSIPKLKY